MEDPGWAEVLNYLYENGAIKYSGDNGFTDSNEAVKELGMPSNELSELLYDMRQFGLVKFETEQKQDSVISIYSLDKDGFEVAHDRQQNKKSEQINKSIRDLTIVLAIAALIQAISTVATVDKPEVFAVIFGSMLFLVIGLVGIDRNWF